MSANRARRVALLLIGLALVAAVGWLLGPGESAESDLDDLGNAADIDAGTPGGLPRLGEDEPRGAGSLVDPQAFAAPTAEPEPAPTTRSLGVRGRLLDERARPVAGARVMLHHPQAERLRRGLPEHDLVDDIPWAALPWTRSDADGRFSLAVEQLVDADGRRAPPSHQIENRTSVVVSHGGYRPRAVSVGGRNWDVDLGDIALDPGCVITGVVVDALDQPVAGARVLVPRGGRETFDGFDDEWDLVRDLSQAHSGTDGSFRVDTHWPGIYNLAIGAAGHQTWRREVSLHARRPLDVGRIVLADGHVIAGRLVDPDGHPVSGVVVKLRPGGGRFRFGGEDTALRDLRITHYSNVGAYEKRAITDASGRFVVDDLYDTTWDVLTHARPFEPVGLHDVPTDGEPLEIVLQPEALLALTVLDGDGRPLPGATATVQRRSANTNGSFAGDDPFLDVSTGREAARRLGRDDADQGLLVAGPAGFVRHSVVVRAPGHEPLFVDLPGVEPGEVLEHELRLTPGARLAGRVLDEHGEPLADARVLLEPAGGDRHDPRAARTVRNGSDGGFAFADVAPGAWSLRAERDDKVPSEAVAVEVVSGARREGLELVLRRAAVIDGVLFGPHGAPVNGALVWARVIEGDAVRRAERQVLTDTHGRFRVGDLRPGLVELWAPRVEPVTIATAVGRTVEVSLHVRTPARVSGRVLEADGKPVAGGQIDVVNHDSGDWHWTVPDADGGFDFDDLSAGDWSLIAYAGPTELTVELPSLDWGQVYVQDVVLPGGRVEGVVRDTDGEPVAGLDVLAMRPRDVEGGRWRRAHRGRSDESGRFEIGRLEAGPWSVTVEPAAFLPTTPGGVRVDVPDGGLATCELRVEPAGALVGRAFAVDGISGHLELVLETGSGDGPRRHALQPGDEFRVEGLRPGEHRYRVVRPAFPPQADGDHVFAIGVATVSAGVETRLDLSLLPKP